MKKSVSQILQEGRARIAAGWVQGAAGITTGQGRFSYCAIGAIMANCREDPRAGRTASEALAAALPRECSLPGGPGTRVGLYNDTPGRTKEEILALFDRALTAVTK